MAKTFKIANSPTFRSIVKVPRVGGEPLDVSFTFKVMNRKELAVVFGRWQKEYDDLIKDSQDYSLEDWADKEIAMQVKQVKDIVVGWGFDDEFNDENIEALVNTAISVTEVITTCYNEAYTKAKSGN